MSDDRGIPDPFYFPELPDPVEQTEQRLLEETERRYHHDQWKNELTDIAAKSKDGAEFKRAIEAAGNIIAKDSRSMVILGENIGDGERYRTRLDDKLAGRSTEDFKKFASAIDQAQLPTPEQGRERLTGREEERSYQRTLSTGKIHDLTYTADDEQAFKSGLEEQGMILAREGTGKFSRTLVVDRTGEQYDLAHIVTPLRAPEFDKMMASLDQLTLPTVEEANALHKQREEEAAVKAEKPTPEASKFLQPEAPAKVEEPAPVPLSSKFLPEQPSGYDPAYYSPAKVAERASKFLPPAARETPAPVVAPQQAPDQPASKFLPEKETVQPTPTAEKPAGIDLTLYAPALTPPKAPAPVPPKAPAPEPPGDDWTRRALEEEFKGLTPPAPAPAPKPKREWEDREIYDLRQATWKRQVREYQEFADRNGREYKQHGADIDTANRGKMEDFDQVQRSALVDLLNQMQPEPRKGFRGVLDAIHRTLNPQDDGAIASAKQEEIDLFKGSQAQQRREYIKVLEENKRIELEKLRERHLAQQAERERSYNDEIERRVAEFKEAKRIARELEAEQREKDLREGLEPPEEGKG